MTTPLHNAKASLRQRVRERLNGMTSQQRETASFQICARLRQQDAWKSTGAILFFAPLPDEPDIWPLIEDALALGKSVALPRFVPEQNLFAARLISNPAQDVQPGQFGIREPNDRCPVIPLNRLDFVLVPGVGFDLNGRRLGRGKGFYDRWLANHHGTTCGVAFDQQIVGEVPVEPHDIRLSCILTPTRWQEIGGPRAVLE